ncbi:hypothetical protein DENSPDRAFT_680927 [Dentipellis sp. KUC8613]|nr:hypothetical protein DENSPDRAFT_680927 [Dentipellis sp. KUC8613]
MLQQIAEMARGKGKGKGKNSAVSGTGAASSPPEATSSSTKDTSHLKNTMLCDEQGSHGSKGPGSTFSSAQAGSSRSNPKAKPKKPAQPQNKTRRGIQKGDVVYPLDELRYDRDLQAPEGLGMWLTQDWARWRDDSPPLTDADQILHAIDTQWGTRPEGGALYGWDYNN